MEGTFTFEMESLGAISEGGALSLGRSPKETVEAGLGTSLQYLSSVEREKRESLQAAMQIICLSRRGRERKEGEKREEEVSLTRKRWRKRNVGG